MPILQLDSLQDLAERFAVFLIDQFGMLHDGTASYPGAADTLARLKKTGKQTLLLSNAGKRSAPNEARLAFQSGTDSERARLVYDETRERKIAEP